MLICQNIENLSKCKLLKSLKSQIKIMLQKEIHPSVTTATKVFKYLPTRCLISRTKRSLTMTGLYLTKKVKLLFIQHKQST